MRGELFFSKEEIYHRLHSEVFRGAQKYEKKERERVMLMVKPLFQLLYDLEFLCIFFPDKEDSNPK
jgi:hypothetical protein